MFLLILYGLALGLPYLGSAPLMSHEVLVAQRTQGLMSDGGWLVPSRNGQADFNKPPLPLWIAGALSRLAGGVSEWTLRLPSVAAAIGTMLILVFYARRTLGWRAALVTGWVWLTSVAALQYSRRAEVDMQLAFWTSLALVGYASGLSELKRPRQVAWFLTMWLSAASAVLTKGPLPLAVLLVTMALTAVFCSEARRVGRMLPLVGPLLFVTVLAAWAVPAGLSHPQAVSTWYMESLGRFAGEMGHEKPAYYYLVRAPALWMPWVVPLAVGIYLLVRRRTLPRLHGVFLVAWALGGLALLSLSTGKRLHYVLPVTPPFLILAGIGLDYIIFVVPRKLTRLQSVLFWLHMGTVPVVLALALVGIAYLPQYAGRVLALAVASAVLINVVLLLYHSNRRLAGLLLLAIGLAAVYVFAVAALVVPLSRVAGRESAIGRYMAERPAVPACVFATGPAETAGTDVALVEFYAGRRLPVVRHRRNLEGWRADHPGGLVLVGKGDVPLLRPLGVWAEALPPEDPRWAESDFELLIVPAGVAAYSPGALGRGLEEPKEISDAR